MREVLYLEVPTPDTAAVRTYLQKEFQSSQGEKIATPAGIRIQFSEFKRSPAIPLPAELISEKNQLGCELSIFVWTLQRTTYLKVFRWADRPVPDEAEILQMLTTALRSRFPYQYPKPPMLDLSQQNIFEGLAAAYPKTVHFFQKMPNGEKDLTRVYWWEQRWREAVCHPTSPEPIIFSVESISQQIPPEASLNSDDSFPIYDLIYIGGALGVIHAAVMAQLGYRVLLVERLPFGRMNREWNISRDEFQSLIDLGLFTPAEFESLITREYVDGFHKFFDANNPDNAKAPVLHTPTVLNIGLDAEKLLRLCGEKLLAAGGQIWDETEFTRVEIAPDRVLVHLTHISTQTPRPAQGRLLVDAMGTASPIAWQLNGKRAFDSVCPTVGAVIAKGFAPEVWDAHYGDVLNSHGDISRGRQLIWELFPAQDEEITIYLFHYHQVHPENPGSLLEMYEDFFTILPEYRRCDLEELVWKKPTFGYIPGHFSRSNHDRRVAFDRLIAIGDAASLQSPLVFTGFGSLVRNLPRLTALLDTALRHDLLQARHLDLIRAYQSNVSVTWLFSRGMMVPTGQHLSPERINAMLNTFFGVLASESPDVTDNFIKDRIDWISFNRMALRAAFKNPTLLLWILDLAGVKDLWRWLGSYLDFTIQFFVRAILQSWFPGFVQWVKPWLEFRYPSLWFRLLVQNYQIAYSAGYYRVQVKPKSDSMHEVQCF